MQAEWNAASECNGRSEADQQINLRNGVRAMSNGHSLQAEAENPYPQTVASLTALFESAEDLIWSVDLNFRIITMNKALLRHLERNFGISGALGKLPEEVLPPKERVSGPTCSTVP